MKIDDGATTYPHRTILVYHLLPGNADAKLSEWVEEARPKAIEVLAKESSGVLSETAIGLIKLLEGAPADLDGIQRRVAANREAIRAFNQCRQALLKGGDGLVPADRLEKLGASIDNSSLKELSCVSSTLFWIAFDSIVPFDCWKTIEATIRRWQLIFSKGWLANHLEIGSSMEFDRWCWNTTALQFLHLQSGIV